MGEWGPFSKRSGLHNSRVRPWSSHGLHSHLSSYFDMGVGLDMGVIRWLLYDKVSRFTFILISLKEGKEEDEEKEEEEEYFVIRFFLFFVFLSMHNCRSK